MTTIELCRADTPAGTPRQLDKEAVLSFLAEHLGEAPLWGQSTVTYLAGTGPVAVFETLDLEVVVKHGGVVLNPRHSHHGRVLPLSVFNWRTFPADLLRSIYTFA